MPSIAEPTTTPVRSGSAPLASPASVSASDEQGHIARESAGDVVAGIEIADLSGNAHGKIPGVEAGDEPDAASAADEVLPVGVHADAERRDRSHSCDDQFFLFHNFIGLQEPGMRAGPGCR